MAVVAFATVVAATAVQADPVVRFSTSGLFDGSAIAGATTSTNAAGDATISVGGATLTYHATGVVDLFAADWIDGVWQSPEMFGYFTIDSNVGAMGVFAGAEFELTVTQLIPVVPAGEETGTFGFEKITGKLEFKTETINGTITKSTLWVYFADPLTFAIPEGGGPNPVLYTVEQDVVVGSSIGTLENVPAGIGGQVAVPLPGAASCAAVLFATVGFFGRRRRTAAE